MSRVLVWAWLAGALSSVPGCGGGAATQAVELASVPQIKRGSLLRPTFTTSEGELSAGSAFVTTWTDGRKLLLTAHHVFGPAGGMSRDFSAAELPQVVKGVRAVCPDDRSVVVTGTQLVSIPGAHAFSEEDLRPDLAGFVVDDPGKAGVLALASEVPPAGARVYLLAEPGGRAPGLFSGRVEEASERVLSFTIDDTSLILNGASGAPVLDAQGRVVGTLLAGGTAEDALHAYANPVTSIREHLSKALASTN